MDIATIMGVLFGAALIIGAIATGSGGLKVFINIPSLGITMGGMLCATLIHFSLSQVFSIFSIMKKTLFSKLPTANTIVQQMVDFAAISKRDGALALEQRISSVEDKFFSKGLQMLVDGSKPDAIRDIMEMEIQYLQERHGTGKKILEFMGAAAPAFGMIGTLIGLVQMLCDMSDPSSIGQGMATALLTTFYGAFSANLIFIPLAGKLGIYSQAEVTAKEMMIEGICAISNGENPTAIKTKMHVFVSGKHRQDVKAQV
ncbi:MAG: MotA/TolQ/ExbB proton channel family protein [Anaerohalosphaera sp.]|nr:MotA/TolQ/ExbB proton channel family protein [Anaerohalosphaera sp.]